MPLPASDEEVFWWSKMLGGATGGMVLLWKIVRMLRADNRTDKGADASVDGFLQTIASLTTESQRKESIISNLSDRLTHMDERVTVEMEARRAATHDALDAKQNALGLQHRLEISEGTVDLLRQRLAVLETENREMRLQRPMPGEMP